MLWLELDTAARFLRFGLASAEQVVAPGCGEARPLFALLCLSTGFERLCKSALLLRAWQDAREGDAEKFKRTYRHDIPRLIDAVCHRCFSMAYLEYEPALTDKQFLAGDPRFRLLIDILALYAHRGGRYYYLDAALSGQRGSDPTWKWKDFDELLIANNPHLKFLSDGLHGVAEYQDAVARARILVLETALRALGRLFSPNVLGPTAYGCSGPLLQWAEMPDRLLGTGHYTASTWAEHTHWKKPVEPSVRVYTRTTLSEIPQVWGSRRE